MSLVRYTVDCSNVSSVQDIEALSKTLHKISYESFYDSSTKVFDVYMSCSENFELISLPASCKVQRWN